jgi:H+/gluconate symporter-like permease
MTACKEWVVIVGATGAFGQVMVEWGIGGVPASRLRLAEIEARPLAAAACDVPRDLRFS